MRTEYKIIKPKFDNDVYSSIKRIPEIEQDLNLENVLSYKAEDKKIFLFSDVKKGWVFSYDGIETITLIKLTHKEILKYFESLKEQFKDNKEVWLYDLTKRIKETKLYLSSLKPNNIKELMKGDKTLTLNTLLYTSWGYDQTNIEMFRIIKFIGKNYFIVQEISQEKINNSDGFMCCSVTAGEKDLNKLPIKAFIDDKGYISICEKGYKRSLFIHEAGKEHYKSWYA